MRLRGKAGKKENFCGILLAISSLPSKYFIGTLGREAYKFIDFLRESGQSYWQLLPLCPVGKGNSPYCSLGSFAGEPLYIDLEMLAEAGLLSSRDIPRGVYSEKTDYEAARRLKLPLLKKAARAFDVNTGAFIKFKKENAYWLKDYALFMAIKESFSGAEFNTWEAGLKYRFPNELLIFEDMHPEEILFYEITQYLFYSQLRALKLYAEHNGIKLMGDIPFYVAADSADVWANPEGFKLGRDMTPVLVAGVPPDVFSSNGQLWGNPVYDWEYQKKNGYSLWKKRLIHTAEIFDAVRIDHFRAFADYYTVPYGALNAKSGKWERGPGADFWEKMMPFIKGTEIIAEDLGGDTPEVRALIEKTGFADMRILQFAFNTDLKNRFLPKNFGRSCVCYTGTHDNSTAAGWYENATPKEKLLFSRLVPHDKSGSEVYSLILFGMRSRARNVIIPLQDYLRLPDFARMNIPGVESGNWEWSFSPEVLTEELSREIRRLSGARSQNEKKQSSQ